MQRLFGFVGLLLFLISSEALFETVHSRTTGFALLR